MRPVDLSCLANHPLPQPREDGDKQDRGEILVVGGSAQVPGAMVLTGTAALRAGAGKLRLATIASAALNLGLVMPEARVIALQERDGEIKATAGIEVAKYLQRCNAVILGPGMLDTKAAHRLARHLTKKSPDGLNLLLDAAALNHSRNLADLTTNRSAMLVLTPHAGEMAGLLNCDRAEIEADPAGAAATVAHELRAVVVLKGSKTHIACHDGRDFRYEGGGVGLATSGSGDTLAGVIGGLLARGAEPAVAALWGVFLHGEAGRRLTRRHGRLGYLARELLAEIPTIMRDLGED